MSDSLQKNSFSVPNILSKQQLVDNNDYQFTMHFKSTGSNDYLTFCMVIIIKSRFTKSMSLSISNNKHLTPFLAFHQVQIKM